MKKLSAEEVWSLRLMGDQPSKDFDKQFPDSDPDLIAAIQQWHQGKAMMDDADDLIETLAVAEGWYSDDDEVIDDTL